MASWILVPCLVSLRNEFNELAPDRDKASDGSIGDTSHAASSSDHNPDETGNTPYEDSDRINEVHAIDVTAKLNLPGWTMDRCLDIIIGRHRAGQDDRLQNVIYNRRIWSRSWGWTPRAYTGPNGHTEHAHFSARYTAAQESDTRPWGLLEEEEEMTPEDRKWIKDTITEVVNTAVDRRVGDVVPRLAADGVNPLPETDVNPTMGVDSALFFLAREIDKVRRLVEAQTPPAR